ncbi:uncharacterized protein BJ171DRAFT_628492 [Polychytrium aggregatum]|uniref:uncharacterized protein n=1 Tax=Polychytrium aggregatum TaxID=110093 RepID=UPI0022FE2BF7|nr:uncharacterized protein BJ171DRAFT_628492 [Polychytrium aggregatum]KAI9202157.1 hypothetical protein BJ171DRAFT_628492 [Polychytrium aggregatum]
MGQNTSRVEVQGEEALGGLKQQPPAPDPAHQTPSAPEDISERTRSFLNQPPRRKSRRASDAFLKLFHHSRRKSHDESNTQSEASHDIKSKAQQDTMAQASHIPPASQRPSTLNYRTEAEILVRSSVRRQSINISSVTYKISNNSVASSGSDIKAKDSGNSLLSQASFVPSNPSSMPRPNTHRISSSSPFSSITRRHLSDDYPEQLSGSIMSTDGSFKNVDDMPQHIRSLLGVSEHQSSTTSIIRTSPIPSPRFNAQSSPADPLNTFSAFGVVIPSPTPQQPARSDPTIQITLSTDLSSPQDKSPPPNSLQNVGVSRTSTRSSGKGKQEIAIATELPEFERQLKSGMKMAIFSKGEFIIRKREIGREMYFLLRGKVEVLSTDATTQYSQINQGSFFGELGVLFDIPRTASIRALEPCQCLVLTRNNLETSLKAFPAIASRFKKVVEQRMTEVNSKRSKRAPVSDVPTMEFVEEEVEDESKAELESNL